MVVARYLQHHGLWAILDIARNHTSRCGGCRKTDDGRRPALHYMRTRYNSTAIDRCSGVFQVRQNSTVAPCCGLAIP